MPLTPAQCRAARALVEISREELAKRAEVAARTISDFEAGRREPIRSTLAAIQRALESAGVEFTNGNTPGVRLRVEEPGAEAVAEYWQGQQRKATKRRKKNNRNAAERDKK